MHVLCKTHPLPVLPPALQGLSNIEERLVAMRIGADKQTVNSATIGSTIGFSCQRAYQSKQGQHSLDCNGEP